MISFLELLEQISAPAAWSSEHGPRAAGFGLAHRIDGMLAAAV